jgi:hypothetical protein
MHWCGKGEAPGPIGPTGPQEKASRHVAPSPTRWCVCVFFFLFDDDEEKGQAGDLPMQSAPR